MRIGASSGKSTSSRCEICSGLQAVDHRRSWRWARSAPSMGVSWVPRRSCCRLGGGRCRRAGPGRTHGASGSWPASLPSVALLRLGLPLRGRGPIPRVRGSRGCVTAKLARDRRCIPPDPASALLWAVALRPQDRDLFSLDERQVPARRLGQSHGRHSFTLTEPATPDHVGHADSLPRPRPSAGLVRSVARTCAQPAAGNPTCPATASSDAAHDLQAAAVLPSSTSESRCCDDQLNPPLSPRRVWRQLGRPGARWRHCCCSVSPGRPPNRACGSHRTGLSTGGCCQAALPVSVHGVGIR